MVSLHLIKYAGWIPAAIFFGLWLGLRDDIAASEAECSERIEKSISDTKDAIIKEQKDIYEKQLEEKRLEVVRLSNELAGLKTDKINADAEAQRAVAEVAKLMKIIEEDSDAPLASVCGNLSVPDNISGLYSNSLR